MTIPLSWAQPTMVCHKTLVNRVKREKMVNARMGVSMIIADAEGMEEPQNVRITLPVHNKKGIRCVWILTWARLANHQP
jgi:hypothetical protein